MSTNPHFQDVESWSAAEALLTFRPLRPRHTAGFDLQALRVHVLDHRRREVPTSRRTLEAHYGGFVLSQSRQGDAAARRLALSVRYGSASQQTRIGGRDGRRYELGPEPEPDDPDGRPPAVVTWHDGELFFLVASGQLEAEALVRIALSLY